MVAAGAVAAIVLAGAAAADDRQDCATGGAELRLAACTRILQSAPADAIALGNRGVAYRVLGRFDAALADLTRRCASIRTMRAFTWSAGSRSMPRATTRAPLRISAPPSRATPR